MDIDGSAQTWVTLTDGLGLTRTYDAPDNWTGEVPGTAGWQTLDLETLAPQPGIGSGNATATQDLGFNPDDVIQISVEFSGSAGVDGLVFTPIPEPGTILLVGLGLGALLLRLKRKR